MSRASAPPHRSLSRISTAAAFTYAVTVERIPHRIAEAMAGLTGGVPLFLLITILVLIVMGAILEGCPRC
jgi:C4-dicarboxylate transporter DctM subunit